KLVTISDKILSIQRPIQLLARKKLKLNFELESKQSSWHIGGGKMNFDKSYKINIAENIYGFLLPNINLNKKVIFYSKPKFDEDNKLSKNPPKGNELKVYEQLSKLSVPYLMFYKTYIKFLEEIEFRDQTYGIDFYLQSKALDEIINAKNNPDDFSDLMSDAPVKNNLKDDSLDLDDLELPE
ncbi:MAG: hypothetical protein HQL46_15105, partial [Gammaproteobacteria bacterium]|nr:hypothetical protein [Gammaproteobacteria bacterium]